MDLIKALSNLDKLEKNGLESIAADTLIDERIELQSYISDRIESAKAKVTIVYLIGYHLHTGFKPVERYSSEFYSYIVRRIQSCIEEVQFFHIKYSR